METIEDGEVPDNKIDGIEVEKASTFRSRNMAEEDGEDEDDAYYEDIEEDNGQSTALAQSNRII